jgi:hypothetical protein
MLPIYSHQGVSKLHKQAMLPVLIANAGATCHCLSPKHHSAALQQLLTNGGGTASCCAVLHCAPSHSSTTDPSPLVYSNLQQSCGRVIKTNGCSMRSMPPNHTVIWQGAHKGHAPSARPPTVYKSCSCNRRQPHWKAARQQVPQAAVMRCVVLVLACIAPATKHSRCSTSTEALDAMWCEACCTCVS